MQPGDGCFFCKKTSHQRKGCKNYEEWKKKNPNGRPGVPTRRLFLKIIMGKQGIFPMNAEEGDRIMRKRRQKWRRQKTG